MCYGFVFADQYSDFPQRQYEQEMLRQQEQTRLMQEQMRQQQEEMAQQRMFNDLQAQRYRSFQGNL